MEAFLLFLVFGCILAIVWGVLEIIVNIMEDK